ncbi:MAG: DotU family type IV/VI secretion system protein [Pseudomonadota bacterium]
MKENYIKLHTDLFIYTLLWARSVNSRQPSLEEVRSKIKGLLDDQLETVNREGYSVENYKQTRFAMLAWLDELIMNSTWVNREEWQKKLLQTEFYRTTNAGEEFFERLEALHFEQKEVREIFLLCLCLGFKGRYCWDDDKPKLEEIIRQNYLLAPEPRIDVRDLGLEKLFPAGLPGTEETAGPSRKPRDQGGRAKLYALFLAAPAVFTVLFLVYRFMLGGVLEKTVF